MPIIVRINDGEVGIIERSEKYLKTIFPGNLHILVPVIDKLHVYNMSPKVHNLPKFSVLLKNSFTVDVNITLKFKIMEPYKARYDVENKDLEYTIERFIIKNISSTATNLSLEEFVSQKDTIKASVIKQLENISRTWGFKLMYFEINDIKKSFLAEQEKEKLYDIHAGEKGQFMSEKINTKDPAKAIHYNDENDAKTQAQEITKLTANLQDASLINANEKLDEQIQNLETTIESIEDPEQKELQLQELEIYRTHQRDMLHLQEKDLSNQQDELMHKINEMSKLQNELIIKQQELINKQNELDKKKQALQNSDNPPET